MNRFFWALFMSVVLSACGGDEFSASDAQDASKPDVQATGGSAGQAGEAGASGKTGSGGSSGTGGASGSGGQSSEAGLGGSAGQAGEAGVAGSDAGTGGSSGSSGSSGQTGDSGLGGSSGTSGMGGSSGEGGSGGQDAGECVPGVQVACDCMGHPTGIKICQADSTFGDCQCPPPPDAGPDAEDAAQPGDGGPPQDASPSEFCQVFGTAGKLSFQVIASEKPQSGYKLGAFGRIGNAPAYTLWGETIANVLTHEIGDLSGVHKLEIAWGFENSSNFSLWNIRTANNTDSLIMCAGKQVIGGLLDTDNSYTANNSVGYCMVSMSGGQVIIICGIN